MCCSAIAPRRAPVAAALILLILLPAACTNRALAPVVPRAASIGTTETIFAVTTRARNPDGSYGFERADTSGFLELTVSIPPTHTPGTLTFGYGDPDPEYEFVLADRKVFRDVGEFRKRLTGALRSLSPDQREVTVFIHGYNATQAETAFRAAQMSHDIAMPGIKAIYSWPSRGQNLGYVYDNDSLLFARDGLERMLRTIGDSGAARLVIVAHSMGGLLAMEALRQIEIADPGWSAGHLGGMVMIAPDIDVDVFRSQVRRMAELPQPFIVFVSGKDPALGLSAVLRGESRRDRLGSIDSTEAIADLPIQVIDTTDLSAEANNPHLVAVTSPTMVALLRDARRASRTFTSEEAGLAAVLTGQSVRRGNGRAIYTRIARPAQAN
ncbi:MAG: alpha/beta hydrolase [Marinibacterium sp.]